MDKFDGRVAVITGAGSGMGRAFAVRFAAEGMPPTEVADKLVEAIRSGAPYLLTDHAWDDVIIDRHRAILAGAAGPVDVKRVTR